MQHQKSEMQTGFVDAVNAAAIAGVGADVALGEWRCGHLALRRHRQRRQQLCDG